MNKENQGFIYCATGDSVYQQLAIQSALSIRNFMSHANIDLFTDSSCDHNIFSKIHLLKNPWGRSKIDSMIQSRFKITIFIDADTIVINSIEKLFDLLDRFDLAATHDHGRYSKAGKKYFKKKFSDAFPQINTGLIVFNRSNKNIALFEKWKSLIIEGELVKDQPLFRELLWENNDINTYILPPEYNLMRLNLIDVWNGKRGVPKIIHSSKFYYTHSDEKIKKGNLISLLGIKRFYKLVKIHEQSERNLLFNLGLTNHSLSYKICKVFKLC